MTKTYILLSDLDIDLDFLHDIKHRKFEQKLLYLEEGAEKFYNGEKKSGGVVIKGRILNNDDFIKFIEPRIDSKKKYALVSLGCGNANKEAVILSKLKNKNISFFGVDSSRTMLERAEDNINKNDISGQLVLADFSSLKFKEEINNLTNKFDNRIFAFLGYTFGNVSQTDMVDTLYNILKKGDYIWLDVVTRDSLDQEEYLKKFNDCNKLLENKGMTNFFFHPLSVLGINRKYGKMVMDSFEEESIGVLRFRFSFQFEKPATVKYRNEVIHILPPEKIKLLDIQIYHPKTMIHFFELHGFKLVDSQVVNNSNNGQFLFVKK